MNPSFFSIFAKALFAFWEMIIHRLSRLAAENSHLFARSGDSKILFKCSSGNGLLLALVALPFRTPCGLPSALVILCTWLPLSPCLLLSTAIGLQSLGRCCLIQFVE